MFSVQVAAPALRGREREYVNDCLDRNEISGGSYVKRFEKSFANYCEAAHAVSCSSGTTALHLALVASGVGPGDEVIVPALTFIATANAVRYAGATPVIVDCTEYWCIDPEAVERAITSKTRAILPVHLYGHPADMAALEWVGKQQNLTIIEDAAEAIGGSYQGWRVGNLADLACFSFYANKTLQCGEGGMVTTNDERLAERIRFLRGQAMDQGRRYWHPEVGYNYRLTNIQAAIGLAQVEDIGWHLERRQLIAGWYQTYLPKEAVMQPVAADCHHAYWMVAVTIPFPSEKVQWLLSLRGVETRPIFPPLHTQPPYRSPSTLPRAEGIFARGIVLPTHAHLEEADVKKICEELTWAIHHVSS